MPGIDVKENTIRVRQKDPGLFEKGSFRTIPISSGVKAVVGRLKGKKTTTIQTYLFDKKKFNTNTVRAWLKKHKSKYSEEKIMKVKAKMDFKKMLSQLADVHFAEDGRWTRKYINDLPDSAFAIILPGGKKDKEDKTVPRSLRMLPYKDIKGKVDLPHLRNALARVNQPKTGLSSAQRAKAKAMLEKLAKTHLKTHKEKMKASKLSEETLEEFDFIEFEEEDVYSKIQGIVERLEAAENLEDAKALVPELKELIPIEEEGENDGEKEPTEEGEKKEEEVKEEKEEEKKEEVTEETIETTEEKTETTEEPSEEKETEENTKLSEALNLNDKILTALKESEGEIDKLKKDIKEQETKFKEQVKILDNINSKYKEDFTTFTNQVKDFLSVFEVQRIQRFNKKVDEVTNDYIKFTKITDEAEKAKIRETISKWSEDMLEQTKKFISAKRNKITAKEPSVLTVPSSKLKESTSFSMNEWGNLTPENKTDFLYKKLVELANNDR